MQAVGGSPKALMDSATTLKEKRFKDLMQSGSEAFGRGDRRLAHAIWREAATLDPYNEKVWLALYRVLENTDDQRVCLQNIIAVNPANVQARRRLRAFELAAAKNMKDAARRFSRRRSRQAALQRVRASRHKAHQRRLLRNAIVLGIGAGIVGIVGGIAVSILVYGI